MTAIEEDTSVVYYAQDQHDGLIKIGHSSNVHARMGSIASTLRRRFALLATEPGDAQVEGTRHRRFGHLRVTGTFLHPGESGEMFHPGKELLALVASLETPDMPRLYGKEWARREVRLSEDAMRRVEAHLRGHPSKSLHSLVEDLLLEKLRPVRRVYDPMDIHLYHHNG